MILSETAARQLFPGQSAIGKRVSCCEAGPNGAPALKLIVGIVGDVRADGPRDRQRSPERPPAQRRPEPHDGDDTDESADAQAHRQQPRQHRKPLTLGIEMGRQPHPHAVSGTYADEVGRRGGGHRQPPQQREEGVRRKHRRPGARPRRGPQHREPTRREQERAEDDHADARAPDLGGDQTHGTRGEGMLHHDAAAPLELGAQQLPDARMVG